MSKRPEARIRVQELSSIWLDLIDDDPWFNDEEHDRMKSTQLPDLPFGISRNGAYTHPPSKLAWVVVGGVAYAESFEQAQYEFKNLRYESVGWDNYQSLRKLWLKMRAGPDRDAIGRILNREEQYWNTHRLRRSSSLYWLRADASDGDE